MPTIADVIDAIEKNGLPKVQNAFAKPVNGTFLPKFYDEFKYKGEMYRPIEAAKEFYGEIGACALGQAAINLDIAPRTLCNGMTDLMNDRVRYFLDRVIELNDNTDSSLKEIAKIVRSEFEDVLNVEFAL